MVSENLGDLEEDVVDEDALHDGRGLLLGLERFVVFLQGRLKTISIKKTETNQS